ncbi:hypothetical protein PIB30_032003 [Stylosanthes scabra]|uniref:RRM domain-containing protein n=1 Tax=Stylosanthes scabra TaxID=79078 RepID=A0ABU6VBG2_9FABA|nr:hypothetical protein [Stylosanthes scabra]
MDKGPNFVPGKLFVGLIPPTIRNEQLREHFAKYGKITESVIIMNDDVTSQRRGYGFVNFADPSAVDKAIEDNNHFINGHKVLVEKCIAKDAMLAYYEHYGFVSDELATFFGEYGQVISCRIERDEHYGSIDFESDKTVDDILAANGNWINFGGRFMLEISKHIIQGHLNNANAHDGYGGAIGYDIDAESGRYSSQSVVGRAGVFTEGASGSGGPSNASQDDNPDSLFSYAMVTKKDLNRHR